MRHTAGTLLIAQGVHIRAAAILRHSDVRTTQGYTHVSSEVVRGAERWMGTAMWGDDARCAEPLKSLTAPYDRDDSSLCRQGWENADTHRNRMRARKTKPLVDARGDLELALGCSHRGLGRWTRLREAVEEALTLEAAMVMPFRGAIDHGGNGRSGPWPQSARTAEGTRPRRGRSGGRPAPSPVHRPDQRDRYPTVIEAS